MNCRLIIWPACCNIEQFPQCNISAGWRPLGPVQCAAAALTHSSCPAPTPLPASYSTIALENRQSKSKENVKIVAHLSRALCQYKLVLLCFGRDIRLVLCFGFGQLRWSPLRRNKYHFQVWGGAEAGMSGPGRNLLSLPYTVRRSVSLLRARTGSRAGRLSSHSNPELELDLINLETTGPAPRWIKY